jgi:hypothetical protein
MGNGLSPTTTVELDSIANFNILSSYLKQLITTICLLAHQKRQGFIFSASVTLETLVNVLIFIRYLYTCMNVFVVHDFITPNITIVFVTIVILCFF